ncbi:TetR/AcrR family transcriptional regulator [Microbacterium soli]|uniref:TetR family transcriptional regulator n=1 Tax=Microbacterium soli TaxID=446075 RepID=A0ABP7NFM5_9MICO
MARPRKDGSPPATTRIETAFFAQLRAMPFQEITVSGLVQAAGVNRNSFYYHYADLEDLARSAVANQLVPEIPRLIAGGFGFESAQVEEVMLNAIGDDRLRHMLTVAGPNSTSELREILKDSIRSLWLDAFRLQSSDVNDEELATMRFVLGGMLEVMSRISADDLREVLPRMRGLPILQAASRIMMQTLAAAAERVASPG